LQVYLASTEKPRDEQHFTLVTFRGRGPAPGTDLDRTSELLERDEIERFARR